MPSSSRPRPARRSSNSSVGRESRARSSGCLVLLKPGVKQLLPAERSGESRPVIAPCGAVLIFELVEHNLLHQLVGGQLPAGHEAELPPCPIGPAAAASRSMSPVERCGICSCAERREAWVPFPAPGGPMKTIRMTNSGPTIAPVGTAVQASFRGCQLPMIFPANPRGFASPGGYRFSAPDRTRH